MRLNQLFVAVIFIFSVLLLAFHPLLQSTFQLYGTSWNRFDEDRSILYLKSQLLVSPKPGPLRPSPRNIFSQGNKDQILFYPRVPKCGSGTFQKILMTLSMRNGFHFVGSPDYNKRMRTIQEQNELVQHLQQESDLHGSIGRTRHVFFINFQEFNLTNAIQVSLIRDPVKRFISVFHWRRVRHLAKRHFSLFLEYQEPDLMKTKNLTFDSWVTKDMETCILTNDIECSFRNGILKESMVSFFCGQHPVCLRYGDQRGVKLALQNVEKHFRLVGLMEQYEDFLIRAEHIIPLFFNGGPTAYKNMVASGAKWPHKMSQPANISEKALAHLQSQLKFDFDLYNFIKKHFQW